MRRVGSLMTYFQQRIPADVRERASGLKLAIPLGTETVNITILRNAPALRFSLRTRDPVESKKRQASVVGYLETVWQALRAPKPTALTQRQAVALAGELYRAWAEGEARERTIAILHTPNGWVMDSVTPLEDAALFKAAGALLEAAASEESPAHLERTLGPLVDRLLLAKGIASVDAETRPILLGAILRALRDAMAVRERNASDDYTPDPKAQRFPAWESPSEESPPVKASRAKASTSLKGPVEDWWQEAERRGLKPSTQKATPVRWPSSSRFCGMMTPRE